MSIVNALSTCATEVVESVTSLARGTGNLARTYEAGTRMLLNHTEYYSDVHTKHNATKQVELSAATKQLPDDVQAMLAQLKANA